MSKKLIIYLVSKLIFNKLHRWKDRSAIDVETRRVNTNQISLLIKSKSFV